MELSENIESKPAHAKRPMSKKVMVLKKIDMDTAKILLQLRERINKKPHGRKVRDSEIIAIGIKLIGAEQIRELQEQSYSEQDRLCLAHEEYQKINGKISLDQFIGRLIRGEISTKKENS